MHTTSKSRVAPPRPETLADFVSMELDRLVISILFSPLYDNSPSYQNKMTKLEHMALTFN